MKMREYQISVKTNDKESFTEKYQTLFDAIMIVGSYLQNLNLLDKLVDGDFIESVFLKTKRCKLYRITNDVPNFTIDIKKISSGDLDVDLFQTYLIRAKELYEGN